jgi:hypothetical protein
MVTYITGVRQRSLSKQLYDQPLISNNPVNNDLCKAIAAIIKLTII